MPALPSIRQIVLLVPDLDAALAEFREVFGFTSGTRDEEEMARLGFEHEIFTFSDTFLEICAPLSPDSHPGKLVERLGSCGYMVDVQVEDLDAVIARGADAGIAPLFVQDFGDHRISQWHPKSLGTLAEFDQVNPHDTWHFAPRIFEAGCSDVALDIVGAELAAADPAQLAALWADLVQAPLQGDTTLHLGETTLRFSLAAERLGLVAVDVLATDPARVGETVHLSGVDFHFVAART